MTAQGDERLQAVRRRLAHLRLLDAAGAKIRLLLGDAGCNVWPAVDDLHWRAWVAEHGDAQLQSFLVVFEEKLRRRAEELRGDGEGQSQP